MKLRNKKTGVVADVHGLVINGMSFDLYDKDNKKLIDDVQTLPNYYFSLSELNEEWEDYTPQEPLIKDEKIRKAIKAWGYSPLTFKQHRRKGYCQFWYLDKYICFRDEFEGLKDMKHYTITELCGEDDV